MASIHNRNALEDGLEALQQTNFDYFPAEMTAEFLALKGYLYALNGNSDEANTSFSESIEKFDTLAKAWALWGDYLENLFINIKPQQLNLGVNAIKCFLHACRQKNENKSRKYLAKVLWLLSYDNENSILMKTFEKYSLGFPLLHWIPWIPQLSLCLVHHESNVILNLLIQIGRLYAQAVYFPIRTLFLTLHNEQQENHKLAEKATANLKMTTATNDATTTTNISSNTNLVQPCQLPTISSEKKLTPTPAMIRCSKVMHTQRDIHRTVLSTLEGIIEQVSNFREKWYEEMNRQLCQCLNHCYVIAFENFNTVNTIQIPQSIINFVKTKLLATCIERENKLLSTTTSSTTSGQPNESNAHDDDLILLKNFINDFDFNKIDLLKLHNLIRQLKKWKRILEKKINCLPKYFLFEEKRRFLLNFTHHTGDIELFGELLMPNQSHFFIRIAKFLPRVEIVKRYNSSARRLYILGTNGKVIKITINYK